MAKFIVHKKGFFYNDEIFDEDQESKGKWMGEFGSLEEAKACKTQADIKSLKMLGKDRYNLYEFIPYEADQREILSSYAIFHEKEFGTKPDEDRPLFPEKMSDEQARKILEILDVSFHIIVEYAEGNTPPKSSFKLKHEELSEF